MSDTLFDASGRVNSSKWAVGDEKTVGDVGEWHFLIIIKSSRQDLAPLVEPGYTPTRNKRSGSLNTPLS